MADRIFSDENGVYQIDCTLADWATDQIHADYSAIKGSLLSDVDFAIETYDRIYLVEYKNACLSNAANPGAFKLSVDKIAKKFFDSLHYLAMHGKNKPVSYVFVVEYPKSSLTDRKLLRERIMDRLPFQLQRGKPRVLIDRFDVVSIAEWNTHAEYSRFPLSKTP